MPRKTFTPAFDALDSIISLSALAHKPRHHKPRHHAPAHVRHVHANAERVPHSGYDRVVTGTQLGGVVNLANNPQNNSNTVNLFGSGTLTVGVGHKYPGAGFAFQYDPTSQTGTLAIVSGSNTLTADVTMLADGTAGNYTITDATGDWAGASGTGVLFVRADSVVINPHSTR